MKTLIIMTQKDIKEKTFKVVERMMINLKIHNPLMEREYLFLNDYHIDACRGCHRCLTHGKSACNIKDDFSFIRKKIDDAQGIIIVSYTKNKHDYHLFNLLSSRFSYLKHRPSYFDKTFFMLNIDHMNTPHPLSNIASQGKQIKPLYINYQEPLIVDYKLFQKIDQRSEQFYKQLTSKKRALPTLHDYTRFHTYKLLTKQTLYQNHFPKNFDYYNDKANYFFAYKGHFLKKMIGRMIGFMIERWFIQKTYPNDLIIKNDGHYPLIEHYLKIQNEFE